MLKLSVILALFIVPFAINAQSSNKNQDKNYEKRIEKLEKTVKKLKENAEQKELESLKSDAMSFSGTGEEQKGKTKDFKSGGRSLQYLNPEMSVVADGFAMYNVQSPHYNDSGRSGFFFRALGLHFQSALDPYTTMKAAFSVSPQGLEFGEAYMIWTTLLPRVSLMVGKFRQQFGVVNRWHAHGLDQVNYPLPLQEIFGEDGLNQIGASFHIILPSLTASANELTLQITNGMNGKAFSGKYFSVPSVLMRFKNYWDLSENTYLELGLTGMFGANNKYGVEKQTTNSSGKTISTKVNEDFRKTILFGADLTLQWEPLSQALYKRFTWRTEFYGMIQDLDANAKRKVYGAYSYIDWQITRRFIIGTRFDITNPYDLNDTSKWKMQAVPYITFFQSPWVHLRLEYQHRFANYSNYSNQDWVFLQVVWAAGPHKHDRY